ncbi:tyrosine-type recombinase/integrase [Actinomadura sp. 3N407]|uniref:tyrosine-type recombinase/integrase n=1 Tax=Actinomadura sp. 3N407 TaxID=3457423 RepID=UPI003FCD3C7C
MTAAGQRKITALRGGGVTLTEAADEFLSTRRVANPNTRRAYASAIDRTITRVGGGDQPLAEVTEEQIGDALAALWGECSPATWNRNRAAVSSWLTWCQTKKRWAAPSVPADAERRRVNTDHTKAVAKTKLERTLSRRDLPLREKTLYRMLYETAVCAAEILALDVQDLDLENRKRRSPPRAATPNGCTGTPAPPASCRAFSGTRTATPDGPVRIHGPLFLAERKPVPARRPSPEHVCPHTGRARLGYDRARVLAERYTGLDLHQLRHSAATHPGEAEVPLQLIMAKTRHKKPPHRHALHQARR